MGYGFPGRCGVGKDGPSQGVCLTRIWMGDLVLFMNKAVCCVIVGYLPRVWISDPVFYVEKNW